MEQLEPQVPYLQMALTMRISLLTPDASFAGLTRQQYSAEFTDLVVALATGTATLSDDDLFNARAYILQNSSFFKNTENIAQFTALSDSNVREITKKIPQKTLKNTMPSTLSIMAFLLFPEYIEELAYDFDQDILTGEQISTNGVVATTWNYLSTTIDSPPHENLDMNAQLRVVADAIVDMRKHIVNLSATSAAELADKMMKHARREGVLYAKDGTTPAKLWSNAFNPDNPDITMSLFYVPSERLTLKKLFEKFAQKYVQLNRTSDFRAVYNTLQSNDERRIIALSAWMVPRNYEKYGWFTHNRTHEVSSFFSGNNAQQIQMDIIVEDRQLLGKPLSKEIKFP